MKVDLMKQKAPKFAYVVTIGAHNIMQTTFYKYSISKNWKIKNKWKNGWDIFKINENKTYKNNI